MVKVKRSSGFFNCIGIITILFYCTFTIIESWYCMEHQIKRGQFSLTWNQVEKIIQNAASIRDRILIQTMSYTGARRAEICGLLINDILPDNKIRLIGKGKIRIVPVPSRIIQDLNFFIGRRRSGFVFQGQQAGRPLDGSQINRALIKAASAARIKNPDDRMRNINPHLLRHSLAHRLKAKNVRLDIIQNILGHANFKTTADIYGLPGMDEISSAYNSVMV